MTLKAVLPALALVLVGCNQTSPTSSPPPAPPAPQEAVRTEAAAVSSTRLTLDPSHSYGDRYASGNLPVGDGHYSTTSARTGYVYACAGYAQRFGTDRGGAGSKGPWFHGSTYNVNQKAKVAGKVSWVARLKVSVGGGRRVITTNDLPKHTTGTFPIQRSDPASAYDRNPNSIQSQSLTYSLPASPTYASPSCMGGESGVMLTGVALFNGFDAGGRDAGAWEVQDSCGGHPQRSGEYHYHALSSCITSIGVGTVIGYALDGFPITGPVVGAHNILTTRDLDACHGITSAVKQDGRTVTTYHYVMTQDFPYSVSCFRGQATRPPGQPG